MADKKCSLNEEKIDFQLDHKKINADHEEVRTYVLTKVMQRPRTNYMTVTLTVLAYILFCVAATWAIKAFSSFDGVTNTWIILAVWILLFFLIAKHLCIKLVECYQHYAKEETRRKCLCMPTCSEYAIAVLKKYCLVIALCKIHKRLFKTCKDGIYKKDPP